MPALKALALSHLRVDVRLGSEGWRTALLQSAEHARLLAIPVELAIHLPVAGHAGLEELPALAARLGVNIIRWLVYRDRRPMVLADDFDTVAEADGS